MRDTAAILFPEDFASTRPIRASVEPPPPGFTADDVAAAREAGFAAGERAGREAEAAATRARVADTLGSIADKLDAVHEAASQSAEASAMALAHLLFDAIGLAFPTLRARHGEAELRRVVAAVVPALNRESNVVLRVHPALAVATAQAIAAVQCRAGAAPRIEPCEQVEVGDAVILWDGGKAVRDSTAAWREVAGALRSLGLPAAPGPEISETE